MHPKPFEYFAPRTIKEAIKLLTTHKDEAKILAGGHSLVPLMKLRLAAPKYIVDINRIPGLSYIKKSGQEISIGALTRLYEIESSPLLKKLCPIFVETAKMIGDPQVRNMATIGGNVAHGDPANDFPPTMLAVDAGFVIRGPRRNRSLKAEEFFVDIFTTALRFNEVLTEIKVPIPPRRSGASFQKFERRAGDFAIVSVAAHMAIDRKGVCKKVGIGLSSVGPTAIKPKAAEKILLGRRVTDDLVTRAAAKCSELSNPISDLRGSAEYKKEMVRVFARRALRTAFERAQGFGI